MLPMNLACIHDNSFADFSTNCVIVWFDLIILKQQIRVDQCECWWIQWYLSGHENDIIHLIDLAVRSNVWRRPVTHTLNVHVLLKSSEFGYCIIIQFAFIVPDSCNQNDLITRYLHANPNWWSQSKLFDILGIQWLELWQIANQQGYLNYEWNNIKCLEMLKYHEKLIFLVHFLDLILR